MAAKSLRSAFRTSLLSRSAFRIGFVSVLALVAWSLFLYSSVRCDCSSSKNDRREEPADLSHDSIRPSFRKQEIVPDPSLDVHEPLVAFPDAVPKADGPAKANKVDSAKGTKEGDPDADCSLPPGFKYDADYWNFQKGMGQFGAKADSWKFKQFIHPGDKVLDVGCGGGYFLLELADRATAYGLEINPHAVQTARNAGLNVKMCVAQLPDDYFDVVYSHHALEHVPNPQTLLQDLKPKLKSSGKMIFVTPFDNSPHSSWRDDDPNHHIQTWNPMLLGNLFVSAGFKVEKCESFQSQWPHNHEEIMRTRGVEGFIKEAELNAIRNSNYQVKCIVTK